MRVIDLKNFNPEIGQSENVRFRGYGYFGTTHFGRVLERHPTTLVVRCMGEDVIIHKSQVV